MNKYPRFVIMLTDMTTCLCVFFLLLLTTTHAQDLNHKPDDFITIKPPKLEAPKSNSTTSLSPKPSPKPDPHPKPAPHSNSTASLSPKPAPKHDPTNPKPPAPKSNSTASLSPKPAPKPDPTNPKVAPKSNSTTSLSPKPAPKPDPTNPKPAPKSNSTTSLSPKPAPKPDPTSPNPKPTPKPNPKQTPPPKPDTTPKSPNTTTSSSSSPYHFANHFCLSRRLDVKSTFCLQVLRSSPTSTKAKDNQDLLDIAAEMAIKYGNKTLAFLKKTLTDKTTKPDMKPVIEECVSAYDRYVEQYKMLMEEAKSEGPVASYDSELAKIAVNSCVKALSKNKNADIAARNKIALDYARLTQNIADSLE